MIARAENELRLGCCRVLERALQVLIEPQGRSDLELGGKAVVQMRGEGIADVAVGNEPPPVR